jgi:hypothetical protein
MFQVGMSDYRTHLQFQNMVGLGASPQRLSIVSVWCIFVMTSLEFALVFTTALE